MLTILELPMKRKEQSVILSDDLLLEQWIVPKGTSVKTLETRDFGYVVLPEGTKDKRGFVIPKRIHRY
jgi:hypothetical protein